ncbi:restriction endonuclease subunit S [Mycoplasma parvum]|uniref:Type I restriction modification DNA specificity domain-containing protein n=1 Tax=Mycoplasma parvum str. Indiana TaxID=1403316 RepID=U5NBY2_9MOLU|nr:restriction endonuclease subunit S [Mycoplasma parvum]AGX88902.1 hypothetical protein PRV_00680 [Mycoplasma parvum str. Indiana]
MSDIVSIKRGEVSAKNSIKEGRYPFFTASKNSPERINKYSYDTNAILITITGHFLSFLYRGKFEASDHCFVLQVKNKNLFYFLFEQLKIKLQILHKEDSGILKTLRIQRLLNLNFPIPDDTILDKFNNICEDIQLKIENLNKRVESSENVKKHLLNKLFSQKIRVN